MFLLNPNSGVPLYVQLHQQLCQRIASGQLAKGSPLPSVRDLSSELHINPLTVSKVYQMLEQEGLVTTRRGIGSHVSGMTPILSAGARRRQIAPAVEQLVSEALHLGLDEGEVQSLLSEKFRRLSPTPKSHE